MITMDRNIEHQQNFSDLPFGVLVVRARSNRVADLRPVVPDVLEILRSLQPGELRTVGS